MENFEGKQILTGGWLVEDTWKVAGEYDENFITLVTLLRLEVCYFKANKSKSWPVDSSWKEKNLGTKWILANRNTQTDG